MNKTITEQKTKQVTFNPEIQGLVETSGKAEVSIDLDKGTFQIQLPDNLRRSIVKIHEIYAEFKVPELNKTMKFQLIE
ncbi:hypothetical protein GF327_06620 [Candidatus Woesearchaeota archaeon]|nr:hypothetical protein [Candidatus Woesearchaeota archaeon]